MRLPTGDPDRLVGAGRSQVRVVLLGSYSRELLPMTTREALTRAISPHFNLGYTWAGDGIRISNVGTGTRDQLAADFVIEPSDEITATGGFDLAWLPERVTVSADVVARLVRRSARYVNRAAVGARSNQWFNQPFLVERRNVGLELGVLGAKVKIASAWLVTAQALWALSDAGLKPGLSVVAGVERVWARAPRDSSPQPPGASSK
ncbi:MAG: hypothetical protein U0Q12_02030 [Vicinamibacterales bacterium]